MDTHMYVQVEDNGAIIGETIISWKTLQELNGERYGGGKMYVVTLPGGKKEYFRELLIVYSRYFLED